MDVDTSLGVRELAHDAWDDRHFKLVEDMREAVNRHGIEPGVRHYDFHSARGRRVAVVRGLDIGVDETAHFWKRRDKFVDNLLRVAPRAKQHNLLLEIGRNLSNRSTRC
jgi:hypothetical protein